VIVKVLEHRKSEPRPLAEVREGIVTALSTQQSSKAALAAAQAASAKIESGAPFDAVAQGLKATADPAHFIGRRDPSVPAQVRDAAFAVPRPAGKPAVRALTLSSGGAAVLEVNAVRTGAVHDKAAQSGRAQQEQQRQGTADVVAYLQEVRRTADVKKNPNAFE
jgi:peptidyl-prolyl cis-trans isomerase D